MTENAERLAAETDERRAEIAKLVDRADVIAVHVDYDDEPHFADPFSPTTLCDRPKIRNLTDGQATGLTHVCQACVYAATDRAASREAALSAAEEEGANPPDPTGPTITAPAVHRFDRTADAYDESQWRDDIRDGDVLVIPSERVVGFLNRAWPVALTPDPGKLHGLTKPAREVEHGRYAESIRVAAEQARELGAEIKPEHAPESAAVRERIAEMRQTADKAAVRVRTDPDPKDPQWRASLDRLTVALAYLAQHDPLYAEVVNDAAEKIAGELHDAPAGYTPGCAPKYSADPDATAARAALNGVAYATLTGEHDITEPTEAERNVRGYAVEPRGHGLVAVYWLEGGTAVRHDHEWHGAALECLVDRLTREGWAVEPLRPSSLCVFAHRPQQIVPEAENHWPLALEKHQRLNPA